MAFRVYAKHTSDKRFKAMDMKNNVQGANLFYASIFQEGDREAMADEVVAMERLNPEFKFELRTV